MIPDISYDTTGVTYDGVHYPSINPRLLFAQMLTDIETELAKEDKWGQRNRWLYDFEGSRVHVRTEFNRERVKIGFGCVIGGKGFGYVGTIRMPHIGNVVLEDGVIIHNNVCIDCAVLGSTIIGEETVIDNLVHVAHGAKIGRRCQIVAGAVIGGSCEIGHDCFIGINASIKNKVKIGNGVTVGMGAVVTKDIPAGETWVGNPAKKLEK